MNLKGPATNRNLSLEMDADIRWVPVLQGIVEKGAPELGLDTGKAMRLSMASEEILAHLAGTAHGRRVVVNLSRQPAGVCCDFAVEAGTDGLWAMNLTSAGEIAPDRCMDHLGLLLASRAVDSFSIALSGRRVAIGLNQDIAYPEITPATPGETPLRGMLSVAVEPEPAEIARACALAVGSYPRDRRPDFLKTPGKVVDLVADGTLRLAILEDEAGTPAGMICWETTSPRSVGFHGPYIFGKQASEKDTADLLTGHMIGSVARTSAVIVYSLLATSDLPAGDFEQLATLDCRRPDRGTRTLWFRHLREDMGCNVWAHPDMVDFLRSTYDRLFLMRTVNETGEQGQARPKRSLFAAELDKGLKEARLRPLLDGSDIPENIREHVRLLKSEGFHSIFFTLDLASGWQAAMGGPLMENGFIPAFVLPYAGESDKAVFQHVETDA